jgi:hypothetical protein
MNRAFEAGFESPWLDFGLFRPQGSCIVRLVVSGNSGSSRASARLLVYGAITN